MTEIRMWEKIPGPTNGIQPSLEYYAPADNAKDAAVVIFPGGAYTHLAPHEGKGYAEFLAAAGIHAFVCEYRIGMKQLFPWPLVDARRAVRWVRTHAAEYGIDPHKIAVMGSSAGGHLAATVSAWTGEIPGETSDGIDAADCRPDATVCCYGVVAEPFEEWMTDWLTNSLLGGTKEGWDIASPDKNVTENTPPAFLWHTSDDPVVNVIHTYRYATALREHGIPHEVHVFPKGSHGLGLATGNPSVGQWGPLLLRWFDSMGWTPGKDD